MCWLRKIGLAVKSARLAANITQKELGDKTGKTSKTISNIERGTVAPSIETLYEISKAVKVRMSDLFLMLIDFAASSGDRLRQVHVK